jgi:hypothetical protein
LKKWKRIIGISTLAASLPLSTSSGVLASAIPKVENLDSLGSSSSNDEISTGLSAEAHKAELSESGNILSITWSIKNTGSSGVDFNWPSGKSYMYSNPSHYSGVTITPADQGNRYHPVMNGESECLCSGDTSLDFKERIEPGEQVAYWSMFSVPSDVDTITLEIPGFDPIEDIPIS